jgi:glutamyl-tRNA synthetase
MLAFLGWNPGTDQEIFSLDEMAEAFSLEKVSKSGARFDFEKAKWFNQQYLRMRSDAELAEIIRPELAAQNIEVSDEKLLKIVSLVKDRSVFPNDIIADGSFLFAAPTGYDQDAVAKKWNAESAGYVKEVRDLMAGVPDFSATTTEPIFKQFLADRGIGFGKVAPQIRLAVTGGLIGPGVFDIFEVLGKDETLRRLDHALATL